MRNLVILILTMAVWFAPAMVWAAEEEELPPENPPRLNLRVLTLNIHGGRNLQGQYDLDALVEFIREINPDLIGLQEVDRNWSPRSLFQDIPAELAARLGMAYAFAPALELGGAGFGNLVLSKYPLLQVWTELLPGSLEQRSLVLVQVVAARTRINFACTHLGLSEQDRLDQATAVMEFVNRFNEPLLLVGDCNAGPDDPAVQLLEVRLSNLQEFNNTPGYGTLRQRDGSLTALPIDNILAGPEFRCESFAIIDNQISDHLPVLAEVSLVLAPADEPERPDTENQ